MTVDVDYASGSTDAVRNASMISEDDWVFTSPNDVLLNPQMTLAEKKELLARWASDACAVTDASALRQLPSGAIVRLSDILASLQKLDLLGSL